MAPERTYKFPWRLDNQFEILVDSTTFFPRMLAAIDAARQFLLLEMYLVASDSVADRLIQAVLEAAERGTRVYMLLDDFGAQKLDQRDRTKLAHPNIQIFYYNPLPSYSTLHNLHNLHNLHRIVWQRIHLGLYRNHRKLLLIDGKIAFAGGAGITDEVDSPNTPEMRWRETIIEIQGPVVSDWQQLFTESWNSYAKQPLILPAVILLTFTDGKPGRVTVNEARLRTGIQRSLLIHLKSARQRIWFATAYIIPSWSLRRKLKHAAKRGRMYT